MDHPVYDNAQTHKNKVAKTVSIFIDIKFYVNYNFYFWFLWLLNLISNYIIELILFYKLSKILNFTNQEENIEAIIMLKRNVENHLKMYVWACAF